METQRVVFLTFGDGAAFIPPHMWQDIRETVDDALLNGAITILVILERGNDRNDVYYFPYMSTIPQPFTEEMARELIAARSHEETVEEL